MAKVLLVEDYVPAARAVTRYLRAHGVDTHHVTTRAGALRLLRTSTPWDGFLLDLHLVEALDGLEVLDAVLAAQPDAPRAIISGSLAPAVHNRALRCGTPFICKPCGKEEIGVLAFEVQCACIAEPRLRAHVVAFGRSAKLSSTEHAIIAWLVVGRTRESYLNATGVSLKTFDAHVGAILLKAKRVGLEVDDRKDLVIAMLRSARVAGTR